MVRIVFAIYISFVSLAFSQEPVFKPINYEEIGRQISDSTGIFYYPRLMNRYENGDTTLSNDEYRILYYGYTFHQKYHPWWTSKQIDRLKSIYAKDTLTISDCDTIIQYASLSVSDFPFDLRQINMLGYAYHFKGKDEIAYKWASKRNGIIEAILSSGDGKTCESGFHVICVAHEYEILKVFRLQMKEQALSDNSHCDRLELEDAPKDIKYIYFNIWRTMEVLSNKFKK